MSIYQLVGRAAFFSGAAATVALAASSVIADAQNTTEPDARQPTEENSATASHMLLVANEHHDDEGTSGASPEFALPKVHDGWVELGDSRPSVTEAQAPKDGSDSPPKRGDAGYIPRLGAGVNPADADVRWSYDFKNVVDTAPVTKDVPVPYPPISHVVPGDLGVVDNQAFHLEKDNRTAEGPRRETTVSDPKWNLTTTDVNVPGAGRVYRFDMVCPDHAGRHGSDQHAQQGKHAKKHDQKHDEVYTGASDFNLSKGHQTFSYHWGDPAFNNGFILAHYVAYGLANTPPSEGHASNKH